MIEIGNRDGMMRSTRTGLNSCEFSYIVALLLLICMIAPTVAQSQEPSELERDLIDRIGSDPIDELDRELFGPPQGVKPEDSSDVDRQREADLENQLRGELGPAGVSGKDDAAGDQPLLDIARKMGRARGLIAGRDSGEDTQKLQKDILAQLDTLLKQACKRSGKRGGSKCSKPSATQRQPGEQPGDSNPAGSGRKPTNKPVGTPNATPGTGTDAEPPDMVEMRDMLDQIWGELPDQQREMVLQLPVEEFLPKYERLIELYFRRLAESPGESRQP